MSADNGIYVTYWPDGLYRVCYAQNFDVLLNPTYAKEAARLFFDPKASAFATNSEAFREGVRLEEETGFTEYGISGPYEMGFAWPWPPK
jgi:hypothetical protein